MYYYRIYAGGYEESYQHDYLSRVRYTQEEFEELIVQAYKQVCYEKINSSLDETCWGHSFNVEHSIFWSDRFTEILKEKGLYSMTQELTASVGFDLTHYGRSKEMDKRLEQALDEIEVDESCWDKNCWRISDYPQEEKDYNREDCLVYHRKARRIKNKTCENCLEPLVSGACEGKTTCEYWEWDGINKS